MLKSIEVLAPIGFNFSRHDTPLTLKFFYLLFSIRYLRVIVSIGGFFWYKATPIPDLPSLTARHVAFSEKTSRHKTIARPTTTVSGYPVECWRLQGQQISTTAKVITLWNSSYGTPPGNARLIRSSITSHLTDLFQM